MFIFYNTGSTSSVDLTFPVLISESLATSESKKSEFLQGREGGAGRVGSGHLPLGTRSENF